MQDYDRNNHSNPDAKAWAQLFIKTGNEAKWRIEDIDEELMIGWFANAMMAMHDHIKNIEKVKMGTVEPSFSFDGEDYRIAFVRGLVAKYNGEPIDLADIFGYLDKLVNGNLTQQLPKIDQQTAKG